MKSFEPEIILIFAWAIKERKTAVKTVKNHAFLIKENVNVLFWVIYYLVFCNQTSRGDDFRFNLNINEIEYTRAICH